MLVFSQLCLAQRAGVQTPGGAAVVGEVISLVAETPLVRALPGVQGRVAVQRAAAVGRRRIFGKRRGALMLLLSRLGGGRRLLPQFLLLALVLELCEAAGGGTRGLAEAGPGFGAQVAAGTGPGLQDPGGIHCIGGLDGLNSVSVRIRVGG